MNCKYLAKRGFDTYTLGSYPNGNTDVECNDHGVVAENVTPEQANQIMEYINGLETRVNEFIENVYTTK